MSESTESSWSGTAKRDVVEELGEATLLLPSLVNRGLEANSRAKYLLTLLQAARARADTPSQPYFSLRDKRIEAGVADQQLDQVVERSRSEGPNVYWIPGAACIHADLVSAVGDMLAPLAGSHAPGSTPRTGRTPTGSRCSRRMSPICQRTRSPGRTSTASRRPKPTRATRSTSW